MTDFVLAPPPTPSVAVAGQAARFPVRRIFCVGRNYAAHAREMGHDGREPPFFFNKSPDTVVDDGAVLPFPPETAELHHEAELVVAIGRSGRDLAAEDAPDHVWGYAAGNDLTRRDLQAEAKKAGRPWDWAKNFDNSAVCGPIAPVDAIGHPAAGRITARVNGVLRQKGDLADMIWPVADILVFLTRSMEVRPGDLIFTGTPAGVGPLQPGDRCEVAIEGVGAVTTTFAGP